MVSLIALNITGHTFALPYYYWLRRRFSISTLIDDDTITEDYHPTVLVTLASFGN
jgi:hypothetical protein